MSEPAPEKPVLINPCLKSGRRWLHHLTTGPFSAPVTLYILTAGAD